MLRDSARFSACASHLFCCITRHALGNARHQSAINSYKKTRWKPTALLLRRPHLRNKLIEQIRHIVRAGAGFGVTLEAERGLVGEFDALDGVIE